MNQLASEPISDVANPAPVAGPERVDALDKLRGIAVAGILVMNIYGFAMPFIAYGNPLAYGGTEWYNLGTWFFTHILFDQKFLPIFSMLFGAGLVLMNDRAVARGSGFRGVWYRRNFWLLVFGLAHGWLIWMGDILFHYALIGLLLYPFRNRSPRALIIIACVVFSVALVFSVLAAPQQQKFMAKIAEVELLHEAGESLTDEQEAVLAQADVMSSFMGPPEKTVPDDLAAYRGSYADAFAFRAPRVAVMEIQAALFFVIWRAGGIMLLGMALMKLGVLSGKRSTAFYRNLALGGYLIGLPLVLYSAWSLNAHQWDSAFATGEGIRANYVGSVFVSLGHLSLFMLLIKSGAMKNLMQRFAAVGRMALSNYLMHSVILTTVFYGHGFGLYGSIPRLWQMAFVVAVVAFQLWLSPIWLARFRFGPAEWLWRSLTYWKRQAMRRVPSPA